jgi:hypothetical protein
LEEKSDGKGVLEGSEGWGAGSVGDNDPLECAMLKGLEASRRKLDTPKLIAIARNARTIIVPGGRSPCPLVPRKVETSTSEITNVGAVTNPERIDDFAVGRRIVAR